MMINKECKFTKILALILLMRMPKRNTNVRKLVRIMHTHQRLSHFLFLIIKKIIPNNTSIRFPMKCLGKEYFDESIL